METNTDKVRVGVDAARPWTLTSKGIKFYYLEPSIDMIDLLDIAHHTSNLCRFTGGTKHFYSVAQHSVFVGMIMKKLLDDEGVDRGVDYWDQILAAFLHDSAEFITNDIASPLKSAIRGRYDWIETGILRVIFEKFGIEWGYKNAALKTCDNIALQVERYYLMPDHPDWAKVPVSEMTYRAPEFQDPRQARDEFVGAVRYALRQRAALVAESSSVSPQ